LLALLLLAAALGSIVALAVTVGPTPVGLHDVLSLLLGKVDAATRAILLEVRLPRVLLAALVGAGLSGAGVGFQALLRNPLADPYILGVSGGAALGAVLFSSLAGGGGYPSFLGRPLAAFAGALITLFLLFRLARVRRRTGPTGLLLVGVVLNAFDSAVILFLVTATDPSRFQQEVSFLVGTIGSPPWGMLLTVGALIAAGLLGLLVLSHRLNVLSLGEDEAGHLGLNVERTLWQVVLCASLVTAAAVAVTGLVGFVGLLVPHALRTVLGPDHRLLLPASALAGGAFLVLADTAARTVLAPVEFPVGVVTALAGGPVFLALFIRRLRAE
jgi:iron complex transport system permease protein